MAVPPPSTPSSIPLDLRTIVWVPLQQFVPWLVAVVIVTLAGYPGVVCVTPMAWLLALRVGIACVRSSKSDQKTRRLQEAGIAGALLGFLQGLLFLIIIPRMGPIQPGEQASATSIIGIMIIMGILAGAGLSWFTAYNIERRKQSGL